MRYLWTTIHVNKMEEGIKFFEDVVGLQVQNRFSTGESGEIAFLGNGAKNETLIELLYDGAERKKGSGVVTLGFEVSNLEEMIEKLGKEGIKVPDEIVETPTSHFFTTTVLEGIAIQFFKKK